MLTNQKPSTVKKVVEHQFKFVKEWMLYPQKPSVRLPEFGTFELKEVGARKYILNIIRKLRSPDITQEEKEKNLILLKLWWQFKDNAHHYRLSKKSPSTKTRIQKLIEQHEQQTKPN
jgi:hypothetical protein